MPKDKTGAWLDKNGRPYMIPDCRGALQNAINRLAQDLSIDDKIKENPMLRETWERDIDILGMVKGGFDVAQLHINQAAAIGGKGSAMRIPKKDA
jgi:hypothetical protein